MAFPAGLLHFLPQAGDVCHDRIVSIHVFFFPDCFKQLFRGDDFPTVLTEIPENVKLNGGEGEVFSVEGTLVAILTDEQAAEVVFIPLLLSGVCGVIACVPAQLGLYPGHQFQGAEWFSNIIICTQREAHDFVHVFRLGAEHQNGIQMGLSNFLAEGKSIHVR